MRAPADECLICPTPKNPAVVRSLFLSLFGIHACSMRNGVLILLLLEVGTWIGPHPDGCAVCMLCHSTMDQFLQNEQNRLTRRMEELHTKIERFVRPHQVRLWRWSIAHCQSPAHTHAVLRRNACSCAALSVPTSGSGAPGKCRLVSRTVARMWTRFRTSSANTWTRFR